MAKRGGRVLVVGSFNVDHVWRCAALPRPGETLAGEYLTGPGGKGFNQATAACRAGAGTTFLCALGNDAGGELARQLADNDRIRLLASSSEAPTGTAGIFVDGGGRNSIVIGPGANADLDAAAVEHASTAFVAAAVVVVQMESPVPTVKAALRAARDAGATTLLNPAPADAQVDAELLALTDILTPNETEFAGLCARHLADGARQRIEVDAVGDMARDALHALCRQLLPHGTVVVTLGQRGCFVSHAADALHGDTKPWYAVPAERVQAIDTTGAGDAFNGALAAAMAGRQGDFASCVGFATRYAALSTERAGAATAMPTLAQLQQRFPDSALPN